MEIWVFLSFSAAIFQTLRFILQKFLSDTRLGVAGQPFLGLYIQLQSYWF